MSCTTGCPTQDCVSYAACLRSKRSATIGLETTGVGFGRSTQKAWDGELSAYRTAQQQGIQPATTKLRDINRAVEMSNRTGVAYRADA
jgi:hypothetical protein